jgi:hypothetical protein
MSFRFNNELIIWCVELSRKKFELIIVCYRLNIYKPRIFKKYISKRLNLILMGAGAKLYLPPSILPMHIYV